MLGNTTVKRKTLNEIIIIRAIACLSVVLLHSIKFVIGFSYKGTGIIDFTLLTIAGLLSSGTAIFILISELLLAYSYPTVLARNFYIKRIKYILFPFWSFSVFYAIFYNFRRPLEIPINIIYNLLGNYHGWFVLVIFQLYILHDIMIKNNKKILPIFFLIITLAINIIYLGIFNFIIPNQQNAAYVYFWKSGFMKLIFAWIFYYSVAYYFGRNYEINIDFMKRYKKYLYLFMPISIIIIFYNNVRFDFGFGSRRIDMILFTICYFFLLIIKLHGITKVPKLIEVVSKYSFGIYLVHYFYLHGFTIIIDLLNITLGYIEIPIIFIGSVISSIFSIWLINKLPFGRYIIGKV